MSRHEMTAHSISLYYLQYEINYCWIGYIGFIKDFRVTKVNRLFIWDGVCKEYFFVMNLFTLHLEQNDIPVNLKVDPPISFTDTLMLSPTLVLFNSIR